MAMRKRKRRRKGKDEYLSPKQTRNLLNRCKDENGTFDKTQLQIMEYESILQDGKQPKGWENKIKIKVRKGIRLLRYTRELNEVK